MSYDEKANAKLEVNSHSSNGDYSSDNQKATSEFHENEHEHLALKKHSEEEIQSSGNWYDQKRFGFRYSSAMSQIVMLSIVLFLTPGMFNALSGIGASISDVKTSDNANVALYSTFASVGFFGGTICNTIGVRASLMFGGIGYALYAGSLLSFYHTENKGFVIFAGAFLGVCASVLWAAQGTIIMSYPNENMKGRAIMIFWIIFNLGAVIGGIIPLADNLENRGSAVNDGTFIAFIVLMISGVVVASFMLPMSKVWKSDGTRVSTKKHPYWLDELKGLGKLLWSEPRILLMFPMFFASNWFYTYQFNDFNAGRFNIRTRSLNSILYWFAQMWGALIFGNILDLKYFKRSTRARIGWGIVFIAGMAIWGGGLKFQLTFEREDVSSSDPNVPPRLTPIDFKDSNYIGPMFLYMFYGMFDAIFQNLILWTLGALSNNPKKVALYAGFYKGIQSAGAAIVWRLDALEKPYMDMFASSWALVHGSLLIAAPLVLFSIKDHTNVEDDGMDQVVEVDELISVKSNGPLATAIPDNTIDGKV
ncbi:major facilitator superfamily domain-containing protein [Scheffersomyces xylosifermentans]|uniref:major facilitator superfamily domain-containing protein n=1 Tax=Scheffersomyces xylosifermentans TaxID=1304137 RepID=UPI00315D34AC